VNYRRFFDINQLIGVRMERPRSFARCHEFIGKLIAEGKVQGCASIMSMVSRTPAPTAPFAALRRP